MTHPTQPFSYPWDFGEIDERFAGVGFWNSLGGGERLADLAHARDVAPPLFESSRR